MAKKSVLTATSFKNSSFFLFCLHDFFILSHVRVLFLTFLLSCFASTPLDSCRFLFVIPSIYLAHPLNTFPMLENCEQDASSLVGKNNLIPNSIRIASIIAYEATHQLVN